MPRMSADQLRSLVGQQITAATGYVGDEISAQRADLMDRYMGELYGDEQDDRSKVVSTDVADTVEWILPALLEIFTSGDDVVSFTPTGVEDEPQAQQETEVVNHVFQVENNGFLVLYSWFKDALIQKNGIVKHWWDDRTETRKETYENLTLEGLTMLMQQVGQEGGEVEIVSQDESVGEDGQPVFSIELRITNKDGCLRVAPVPPEEFLVAARHNSILLDRVPFCAHKRKVTVSELIEQGYDRKQVHTLTEADDDEFGDERTARFEAEDNEEADRAPPAGDAMREVLVHECYIRVDYDGDGIAELRKITVGGAGHEILKWADGKGLDNEEVEDIPFKAVAPILMTHRFFGRAVAELVTDIQRIKTVLWRQMLDNIYLNNNQRTELPETAIGENTIEDLLTMRPGGIVRTAMPGMMREIAPPSMVSEIFPTLEYVDTVRENRTGVTRYNQGLDANSLNKTASGLNQVMTASQQKLRLIARVMAEVGVRPLFLSIHKLLIKHAGAGRAYKLRNGWAQVDPREWKHRANMTVNVGLGTGGKDQMMAHLGAILGVQKEVMAAGLPLVTPKQIYNTAAKLVENTGLRSADPYFIDPDGPEGRQMAQAAAQQGPPPDPKMMEAQAKAQLEQQKAEASFSLEQQKMQADLQADMQRMQAEGAMKERQMAMDNDLKREQIGAEMALKREQLIAELQLKREQIAAEIELRRQTAVADAGIKASVATSRVAPGGDPG